MEETETVEVKPKPEPKPEPKEEPKPEPTERVVMYHGFPRKMRR